MQHRITPNPWTWITWLADTFWNLFGPDDSLLDTGNPDHDVGDWKVVATYAPADGTKSDWIVRDGVSLRLAEELCQKMKLRHGTRDELLTGYTYEVRHTSVPEFKALY